MRASAFAEVYLAEGDKRRPPGLQVVRLKGAETESMNMQRRVALAEAGSSDTADAQRIFNQIIAAGEGAAALDEERAGAARPRALCRPERGAAAGA
ncbi:hypothetical protein MJK72_27240 [Klebsiella pneumoniae]|nr:hypothetical protein MJK72_27240 [Klebsiella pneumoniae]